MCEIMGKKIAAAVAVIVALILFAGPATDALQKEGEGKRVIGSKERIALLTPGGVTEVVAKIDTGTDLTSIDEGLALSYGLKMLGKKIWVRSAQGRGAHRNTVRLTFVLNGRKISTLATVADRSELTTRILIGKKDLHRFIVDPKKEFLSESGGVTPSALFTFWDRAVSLLEGEEIIVVPILGALVVVLRSMVGIRTYGIFAPVVIALSLMGLDIVRGLLVYIYLILTSLGVKRLILNRFRLLRIAEMALIIFTLVISLAVLMVLPTDSRLSLPEVFFPLIITSHVIERFTKTVEEYRTAAALPLLLETFAAAVILAFVGNYLMDRSMKFIWTVFVLSIGVVIVAGRYRGLRMNEIFRFKFLRKKP